MSTLRKESVLVAALAATVALIVAACGGSAATATPAPTATAAPSTPRATTPTPTPAPTAPPATPTSPAATPRYGGILQARVHRDWANWDTYDAAGGFTTVFNQQPLSNLIRYKKDSARVIEGDTAESWDVSADGKTVTIRLRKDIKWHDGRPFTAADVKYNLERAGNPRYTFNKERVAVVSNVEAPDPSTVRVNLKRISASFIPNLAGPFMLMYPAHIPELAQWQKSPVGTGAYSLKEYNKDVSYVYSKNPNYYGKDPTGRQLPYLDGIVYNVIVDKALALGAFRSGRLHCGCGFDEDFLTPNEEQLRKDIPGVKLAIYYGAMHTLQFNVAKPPFNNMTLRQAVGIGFDKDKVASIYYGAAGKNYRPATFLLPPELGGQWAMAKSDLIKTPGYNPDHSVDVRLAQQKFVEAGIDPKTVDADINFSSFFAIQGELIATVLGELGIKVKARGFQQTADRNLSLSSGDFTISHLTTGNSIDDPFDGLASAIVTGASFNWGKYSNPRIDALMEQQDAELDVAKRRVIMLEVEKINLTEFAFVPFLWVGNVHGTRPEVFNHYTPVFAAHAAYRLEDTWLGS